MISVVLEAGNQAASDERLEAVTTTSEAKNKPITEDVFKAAPAPKKSIESHNVPERVVSSASVGGTKSGNDGRHPKHSQKKIFLLLAIGAAVIFSVVNLRPLFFPSPMKEEVVIIQEVAPESAPTNAPAELVAEAKPVDAAAPVAVIETASAAVSSECPAADASPIRYQSEVPKKAVDMVYVQAKTIQTICVVDGSGKTQNKVLEPGIGVSFFGKPPLKVLTGGLNQVDLYFQGAKVRLGNASNKTVILEQADIVQPVVAPVSAMDSQAR